MKQKFDVHIIGYASRDAKSFTVNTARGGRQLVRFTLGVNTGKDDKRETFWFDVACFGDEAIGIKKGMAVEVFGYVTGTRAWTDAKGKSHTEIRVTVKTNEGGIPTVNYEGIAQHLPGVSDEAVAANKSPSRQVNESLEIRDDDVPEFLR